MAWQPTKPGDPDFVLNSVGSSVIRGNFTAIDTAWDINHVGIGDTNEGKHSVVHIREGSEPTTTTNEIALWVEESGLGTGSESHLYLKKENNGSTWPFTVAEAAINGFTILPSGIIIKWGQGSGSGAGTVTFPTGTSNQAFTTCYRVYLQPYDSSSSDTDVYVRLRAVTATNFTYYASPRTTTGAKSVTFNYLAIGV